MATLRICQAFTMAAVCFGVLAVENLWMQVGVLRDIAFVTSSIPDSPTINGAAAAVSGFENKKNTTSEESADNDYYGVAITTAFNHKRDIFKHTGPVNATFDYIEKWYRSVEQHPSIKGIVLHNMFSEANTTAWSKNGQFQFVPVPETTASFANARDRPINDMRFFVLEAALAMIEHTTEEGGELPYILFSDAYDVAFLRNPFELMVEMDELLGQHQLYIGEESLFGDRKKEYDGYMMQASKSCFGKELPSTSRMINCGLVGGHHDVVFPLVKKLREKLEKANPRRVCDQVGLLHLLNEEYGDKYISGYPFNSRFMKYENNKKTTAYIAHK